MAVVSQRGLRDAMSRARQNLITAYMAGGMTAQQAALQADNAVLTRSYLRLEQLVNAGPTITNFPVLNNQTNSGAAVRATEKRLNQQDTFFATDIGIYLGKASSATDASFPLFTFPDAVTFPTGSAAGNLQTIYNGFMSISINNSVIVPGFDLLQFLQIPQTQLTAATNSPITQFDPSQVSIFEPMVNFIGTKNTVLNLILPASIGAVDTFTYYVIILRGVLAQNVTLMS